MENLYTDERPKLEYKISSASSYEEIIVLEGVGLCKCNEELSDIASNSKVKNFPRIWFFSGGKNKLLGKFFDLSRSEIR